MAAKTIKINVSSLETFILTLSQAGDCLFSMFFN